MLHLDTTPQISRAVFKTFGKGDTLRRSGSEEAAGSQSPALQRPGTGGDPHPLQHITD